METCGPYIVVEQLGNGSVTSAWRVVHGADGAEGPFRVIRRPLPAMAQEHGWLTAWKQLGSAAMGLRHPNIVPTLEVAELPGSGVGDVMNQYLVSDHVAGVPLNAVLNFLLTTRRDVPRAFAFHVAGNVLAALDYAHGVARAPGAPPSYFHGDLAPPGVFVAMDGRILLSDFGMGRARAQLVQPQNQALRARYHYMAPETARDGMADWRSDLYAVGVMLHEMLAMRRMRRGTQPEELKQQVVAGTWPTLGSLGLPTDDALDGMLSRALADHPAQRLQGADIFLRELNSYIQSQNLAMAPEHIAQMMAGAFPDLAAKESTARALARDTIQAALEPQAPPPDPAHEAESAPPGSPAVAPASSRPRAAPAVPVGGGGARKLLIGAAAAVVVASVGGYLVVGRRSAQTVAKDEGPVRDLTRLVGGRTTLSWSERTAEYDKAIAAAKAAGDNDKATALQARRDDLVRKARALGMTELAKE